MLHKYKLPALSATAKYSYFVLGATRSSSRKRGARQCHSSGVSSLAAIHEKQKGTYFKYLICWHINETWENEKPVLWGLVSFEFPF